MKRQSPSITRVARVVLVLVLYTGASVRLSEGSSLPLFLTRDTPSVALSAAMLRRSGVIPVDRGPSDAR
ncbi:MAG TPA: hypothetical protein VG840_00985, partial [Casimicrobiaceae bacterium]|nr:hypothetical protein [Casimicrobiaceae bacterium]